MLRLFNTNLLSRQARRFSTAATATVDTPAQIKHRFLKRLDQERDASLLGGGQQRIDNQHK